MSKKITKILGIIFAGVTLLSLFAPLYRTTFTDGEAWTLTLYGYDLYEFSAWGVVTAIVPILLIGIMLTYISDKVKSAIVMGTFILGNISVQVSNTAMHDWIYGEAADTIHHFDGLVIYVACLLCASVFCFVHCIQKNSLECPTIEDFRDYLYNEKIPIETNSVFEKEFLLYNKPAKIIINDKRAIIKERDANILFATPDRYFITNERDDFNNDEIEVCGEIVGFTYKNTFVLGLVNIFYPDVDLTSYETIKVMPASEISTGKAELYYNGKRTKINLSVKDGKVFRITATFCDDNFDINEICGGVIIQNGKLAAVATYYDQERKLIICQDAEEQARELHKAIYEQELFEIAGGFQDFWQKNKYKKRDLIVYSEY